MVRISKKKEGGTASTSSKKNISESALLKKKAVSKKKPKTQLVTTKLVLKNSVTKREPKITISDNTKQRTIPNLGVTSRRPLAVLIPSPFRFPVPFENNIGSIARYAGLFFMFVGSLFSLIHLESATGNFAFEAGGRAQSAEIVSSVSDTTTSATSVDTTPEVRISVTTANVTNTSIGTLLFMINVADALEIKLVAEEKTTGALTVIGSAQRVDNATWKYYWDASHFPSGDYIIRAVIKNAYGTYEHIDNVLQEIANNLASIAEINESETDINAGATTTQDITVVTPVDEEAKIVILHQFGNTILQKSLPLNIFVRDAKDVKVYARNTKTLNLYYVGYAIQQSESEWKVVWDTTKLSDGTYKLQAKAIILGKEVVSATISATVDNVDASITTLPVSDFKELESDSEYLNPAIDLKVRTDSPLSNFADITVTTSQVKAVEIYVLPRNALTPFFLGLAKNTSTDTWKYSWNTTQTPNGEFYIYARVKTEYGFTEGAHQRVSVLNEIAKTFTPEEETSIDVLMKADDGLTQKLDVPIKVPAQALPEDESVTDSEETPVVESGEFIDTLTLDDGAIDAVQNVLNEFDTALNQKLNDLAKAMRNGDENALTGIKAEIENLNAEILEKISSVATDQDEIELIRKHIFDVSFGLTELTIKNEKILHERIGDVIVKDSDKDELSDYDEINLYRTNPFVADTDGDSYIDSAEIKDGYNPHDSRSEALVTYDSPKSGGIVRDDIFEIESITTLSDPMSTDENEENKPIKKRAILSGKGLPSSFVTLYIFSTPIVVTVKTDSEGGWTYILDKELEDGSHDVYVGITDNAGRIVAKSNPFPFVKTAEAFTKAEAVSAAIAADNSEPKLFNNSMLLLIASIAVVAIGLVLILLGLHVRDRKLIEPMTA